MGKFLSNRWESRLEGVENRATPQQTPVLKLPIFQQGPFTLSWHPSQQGPPPRNPVMNPSLHLISDHCCRMLSRLTLVWCPHLWTMIFNWLGLVRVHVDKVWILLNIGCFSKQQQRVCRALLTLAVFSSITPFVLRLSQQFCWNETRSAGGELPVQFLS